MFSYLRGKKEEDKRLNLFFKIKVCISN